MLISSSIITEPTQPPNGSDKKLEKKSTSELAQELENMVRALHPDILICRVVAALTEARRKLRQTSIAIAHDESKRNNATPELQHRQKNYNYAQELHKVQALEHIVDLCLTEAKGSFICREHELNTLLRYAVAYINTITSKRNAKFSRNIGNLRNKYELSIPYHITRATVAEPQTPEEAKKLFMLVDEENQRYLAPVFTQHLKFTWDSFISILGSLVANFLYAPGFVSRQAIRQVFEDVQGFNEVLSYLEYNEKRAQNRLKLPSSVRTDKNKRLLFIHPIPSTVSGLVISAGLLCDSLNWYVYTYRKKSHAFLKAKGHFFEDKVVQILDNHSWKVVARNLVITEAIVPGESKAEYDIIAVKGRHMLIIEAKCYTPEIGISGYSEAKRSERATKFAKKLRLKAEYVANNISEISKLSVGAHCSKFIPVLLSTYPFIAESLFEGVAVLTEPELAKLLMSPDSVDKSIQINLPSKP